jgi:hypothetical protein
MITSGGESGIGLAQVHRRMMPLYVQTCLGACTCTLHSRLQTVIHGAAEAAYGLDYMAVGGEVTELVSPGLRVAADDLRLLHCVKKVSTLVV